MSLPVVLRVYSMASIAIGDGIEVKPFPLEKHTSIQCIKVFKRLYRPLRRAAVAPERAGALF